MRRSRLLARRIAWYEAILKDATTIEQRQRIVAAIKQARGQARQHWHNSEKRGAPCPR